MEFLVSTLRLPTSHAGGLTRQAARRLSLSLFLVTACAGIRVNEIVLPTAHEVATLLAENVIEVPPIGSHERPISGASTEAQAWFNQGLRYSYSFNQDQAAACYARAALAAPECPMAWWGISYVLNVDINNQEVLEEEAIWALVASREAQRLAHLATPVERAMIAAAANRTVAPAPPHEKRGLLDKAYAEDLATLWENHQQDVDVGALYAESLMLLQPWNYWTSTYEPIQWAEEIVELLERCLDVDPSHPGANHFYIHMVESSGRAERGIASADRLGELMPGAGHLVHMPSHIYINVGRYDDAIRVNQRAVELDEAYFLRYQKPTFYMNYYAHNIHFITFAAMMEGRKNLALDYIGQLEVLVDDELIAALAPAIDGMNASRMHVYIRFGMWNEIMAHPGYAEFRKASRTLHRYARTVALANLGRTDEARRELAYFDAAAAETPEEWMIAFNPSHDVFRLARLVAEAELVWREGDPKGAIAILRDACALEDELLYTEPPPWMIPVRHALGAIQIASGDFAGAGATYRDDLKKHKGNAWSLLGLHQALTGMGKLKEAATLQASVQSAWERSDVAPPASCYCAVPLLQKG